MNRRAQIRAACAAAADAAWRAEHYVGLIGKVCRGVPVGSPHRHQMELLLESLREHVNDFKFHELAALGMMAALEGTKDRPPPGSKFGHWAIGPCVTTDAPQPGRAAWDKAFPSPLVESVEEWVAVNAARLVPPEHASAAIAANEFCGVRANDDDGYLEHYLVTEQAMTACVAAHGLPADCTAELHASLAELVHTGHLERDMAWYVLPGESKRLFYVLNAERFE